jgi:isopentenyl phosphate kinase|eukprot:g3507.t1
MEVVVIKLGGGLITQKDSFCTPIVGRIYALARAVKKCIESGVRVVIVHGAGSFGHLRSRRWRLNEGHLPGVVFPPESDCLSQAQAVSLVRQEMLTLNRIVCDALKDVGVVVRSHPPHQWVVGTGLAFQGDVRGRFLQSGTAGEVDVTFGDVVNVKDSKRRFSILSGDDLVVRLSLELPNVKRLVFAIGGVDGLLRVPPSNGGSVKDLIKVYTPSMAVEMEHHSAIDVTGGIGLKVHRGVHVSSASSGTVDVYIVNGEISSRVVSACLGQSKSEIVGTKICGQTNARL